MFENMTDARLVIVKLTVSHYLLFARITNKPTHILAISFTCIDLIFALDPKI